MNAKEMLMVFARYGVQKTSMEDIAKAAGVSRQSIYKRFGSKDGVLEWVLTSFIEDLFRSAVTALRQTNGQDPRQTVLNVFDIWAGDVVPIVGTTAHGAEILDRGMKHAQALTPDWEGDLLLKLAVFLTEARLAPSLDAATEQAFALNMASKGIMLKSETSQEFSQAMRRIVDVVLP